MRCGDLLRPCRPRAGTRRAGAGRTLVAAEASPDIWDIPIPYVLAPRERIDAILALYQYTGAVSAQAAARASHAATAIRAPSRVLVAARSAVDVGHRDSTGAASNPMARLSTAAQLRDPPVGLILHGLGVTSPELLRRGAEIDRAGEQLIVEATPKHGLRHSQPSAAALSRLAGNAALGACASGNPHHVPFQRERSSLQREPPEAEP
jgi:hypothetical protein